MTRLQRLFLTSAACTFALVAWRAEAQYPPSGSSPPAYVTPEQARWWAENRRYARSIGPGLYRIEGHGIFDEQGRRVQALSPPVNSGGVAPPPYSPEPRRNAPWSPEDSNLADTLQNFRTSDDDGPGLLQALVPWRLTPEVDQNLARQRFLEAENAMRAANYDRALDLYEEAKSRWPNSPLEEDAMFMIGECYFFTDRYPKAFDAYEELLAKYKRSRHLEKAVAREFAIGQFWLQLYDKNPTSIFSANFTDKTRPTRDTLGNARRAFLRVRLNDPTGKLADDSLMATAGSHFRYGEWNDAAYHYTVLVREYPDSPHQYDAHLLGIQSNLRSYQGPDYDAGPLEEAELLLKQATRQFPHKHGQDRERLLLVEAQIRAARAERDYQMAEFFVAKGFIDAARQYHRDILVEYPNTPIAARVRTRLGELADQPGNPPPRFAWLTAVFPEEKNELNDMIRQARAPTPGPLRR
ncbi:MAG: outer membrane protein assembly factor BamD [Planctomycetota bacterium]|nr:MAG: outer membrane protein assembly factor BamD [Planctomycetota bacterium]